MGRGKKSIGQCDLRGKMKGGSEKRGKCERKSRKDKK
jgi:hypothetical protein